MFFYPAENRAIIDKIVLILYNIYLFSEYFSAFFQKIKSLDLTKKIWKAFLHYVV